MTDQPTPTPRTDAIAHAGHNESVYIARMTYLARELERELAAERALPSNLLDVHAICDQRDNALEDLRREQALADRLAGDLSDLWHHYTLTGAAYEVIESALAAWKGSMNETR